jgi:hypothetical protein
MPLNTEKLILPPLKKHMTVQNKTPPAVLRQIAKNPNPKTYKGRPSLKQPR